MAFLATLIASFLGTGAAVLLAVYLLGDDTEDTEGF